jgi:type I restriction enzyme R subunit
MTTGVDCKTCKLIVLDNNINSMTEFKQIIGRGTRLKPEYYVGDELHKKEYFTIMDFRDACRLFADPDFDGDPIPPDDTDDEDSGDNDGNGNDNADDTVANPPYPESPDGGGVVNEPLPKYRVNDVDVTILNERVQYYDVDGKLITESVTDYSKKNILGEYATLDDFLQAWNTSERKQIIIDELKERGVLLDALREAAGNRDVDDFDLICHIAFDKKPLTKAERAANVRKRDYFNQYEGIARDVLSALLDKYAVNGVADLEQVNILQIDPFRAFGDVKKIIKAFGGKNKYFDAVKELQNQIYTAA